MQRRRRRDRRAHQARAESEMLATERRVFDARVARLDRVESALHVMRAALGAEPPCARPGCAHPRAAHEGHTHRAGTPAPTHCSRGCGCTAYVPAPPEPPR